MFSRCQVLDHPFICRLEETFETRAHTFLVMELLHGRTLSDVLAEKKQLPLEQARHFAAEILLAMGYVHDLKIVHRDLKVRACFSATSC